MVKKQKYILRDENAKELNDKLGKMIANIEESLTSIDEAVLELTVNEIQRINRNPLNLSENLEDVCAFFEFKTQKECLEPILNDLRGILYKSVEMEPTLERKKPAPYVPRQKWPAYVMEKVVPLIKEGKSFEEIAKTLDISNGNLSEKVGIFGGWHKLVNDVTKLNGD